MPDGSTARPTPVPSVLTDTSPAARPVGSSFAWGPLLAVFGCLFALLVAEGALRLYAEWRAPRFNGAAVLADDIVADPLLVAWFKPNYRSPDGQTTYDERGLRLNGGPRNEPLNHPLVLLGGSTAYGWGNADMETISAVLERSLRADGDASATVVNAGYPGLQTLDTRLVYQAKVASLQPSRMIVLAGLNDLYYASDWLPEHRLFWENHVYEVGLRARREPSLRPLVNAIDSIALRNCYTCYAVGNALSQLYERTFFMPALDLSILFDQQPLGAPNDRAMQLAAWVLDDLARQARADGSCLIVAWQPIAGVPVAKTPGEQVAVDQLARNAPAWPTVAPQMFQTLRTASAPLFASGLASEVDLTGVFDGVQEQVYVPDGVHYTALGNRLIADALKSAAGSAACGNG
jgi:lysophospholipase L1-like esterase